MKNHKDQVAEESSFEIDSILKPTSKKHYFLSTSILLSSLILSGTWIYTARSQSASAQKSTASTREQKQQSVLVESVIPSNGVVLPVKWGDLGKRMVDVGVIDANKFKAIYEQRGTFNEENKNLLFGSDNGNLKINNENSGYILNLLWAFGLGNKNTILETGEMTDPKYGGVGNFASTGGWTIAVGKAMNHYSKHSFVSLTPEQQALVEKISNGIYRPCCGNSTHFPDCNHGMAMLGLLELMASQGVSEQDMWKAALTVNSYWFPNNYLAIATYEQNKGVDWKNVNPQEMLGASYSSSRGNANIASQITQPAQSQGGGNGCGVEAGGAPQPQQGGSGCGI